MTPLFAKSSHITARENLVLHKGRWSRQLLNVRYGLFVHPDHGPTLIDTGYTDHAMRAPGRGAFLRIYSALFRARLHAQGQPETFLARQGFTPADIETVIVTHFHTDHISGLHLFPNARLIAHGPALARVRAAHPVSNALRGVFPELLPHDFENRLHDITSSPKVSLSNGLTEGADILGDGSVLAIDLPGHADGHFGLLFPQTRTPFLYAVDAQWLVAAFAPERHPRWPAKLITHDHGASQNTAARIDAFRSGGGAVITCHDPAECLYDEDVL